MWLGSMAACAYTDVSKSKYGHLAAGIAIWLQSSPAGTGFSCCNARVGQFLFALNQCVSESLHFVSRHHQLLKLSIPVLQLRLQQVNFSIFLLEHGAHPIVVGL